MPRYIKQSKTHHVKNNAFHGFKRWEDTDVLLNSKKEIDDHIGFYNEDYEWRSGYMFKHFEKPVCKFVWNSGAKKGQDVKVF